MRSRGEDGFTISEVVLVAVFVVGLLVVALTSINGIGNDTAFSECQTELRTLKMRSAQYESLRGRYPRSVDELVKARLTARDDVDRWEIVKGGGHTEPAYRPTGSC